MTTMPTKQVGHPTIDLEAHKKIRYLVKMEILFMHLIGWANPVRKILGNGEWHKQLF